MLFLRLLQLRGWLPATPNLSTSSSTRMVLYITTCVTVLMCLKIGVTCLETKDNNDLEYMAENEETTYAPEDHYVDLMRTEGYIVEEEPVDEYTKKQLDGFHYFRNVQQHKISEDFPDWNLAEIEREIIEIWNNADDETQIKYINDAVIELEREEEQHQNNPEPRGVMSAYAFFVQDCRQEHEEEHPGEDIVFKEFSRNCALKWSTMSEKEKICYHEMAAEAQQSSNAGIQNDPPPMGENEIGRDMKREYNKDPTAPKRPLSAFSWRSLDDRGKVKELHPEYIEEDIVKELEKRWIAADSATKSEYETKAAEDDARYKREMNEYKMKWEGDAVSITLPPIIIRHHLKEDAEEKDHAKSDK